MSKNKSKQNPVKQHFVPQCYLREFADPSASTEKDAFVWIFDKDGKNKRLDKVKNVLFSNDLYTIKIKGKKNYFIEKTLQNIEGSYATVFREKISKRLPLTEEEHIYLCIFVAVMLQRTLRHKDSLGKFLDQLIERAEKLEHAHGAQPRASLELKEEKENAHKLGLIDGLPTLTELLARMSVAFIFPMSKKSKFITSDDPVTLFNSDLQWQRFMGPGLGQDNIQLTLALSPDIMLCMTWVNMKGYIGMNDSWVQNFNRMTRGFAYKYIISHSPKLKRYWFRRYPNNPAIILKAIKFKVKMLFHDLKYWYKYGRHNKR